jgi:hypothetical protein
MVSDSRTIENHRDTPLPRIPKRRFDCEPGDGEAKGKRQLPPTDAHIGAAAILLRNNEMKQ